MRRSCARAFAWRWPGSPSGIAGAVAAGRVMETLLHEVQPRDPAIFAGYGGAADRSDIAGLLYPCAPRRAAGSDARAAIRVVRGRWPPWRSTGIAQACRVPNQRVALALDRLFLARQPARACNGEKAEKALEIFASAFVAPNSFHLNGHPQGRDRSGKGRPLPRGLAVHRQAALFPDATGRAAGAHGREGVREFDVTNWVQRSAA